VDVDGGGPALLALGAGEHGAPDHHPQVAEGDPAGHADEVDAVGGRQDLERVIRLPPQYWLEVVVPEGLGEERRLELVLAVGDGRAADDLGRDGPGAGEAPCGPALMGSRLVAASAAGPPASASMSARLATMMYIPPRMMCP